jgi:hypothetical protein
MPSHLAALLLVPYRCNQAHQPFLDQRCLVPSRPSRLRVGGLCRPLCACQALGCQGCWGNHYACCFRFSKTASKAAREEWLAFTKDFFISRDTLAHVLLLVDCSLPPQQVSCQEGHIASPLVTQAWQAQRLTLERKGRDWAWQYCRHFRTANLQQTSCMRVVSADTRPAGGH